MLGSYFDLKREIAQIAARRAAEQTTRPSAETGAYFDFDDRIRAFVATFDSEDRSARIALRSHAVDAEYGSGN